jgi:hypothetical protein
MPSALFLLKFFVHSFRRCLHHEALLALRAPVADHIVCLRPGSYRGPGQGLMY